jgi:hypothetical protein
MGVDYWYDVAGTATRHYNTVVAAGDPAGYQNLVAPQPPTLVTGTQVFSAANTAAKGCRVVVPKTGTLRDFAVYVGTTSGNLIGAIYDTGDTTTTVRTKLWDSGSVAAGSGWQILGDPALAVTAGQQLDFMMLADNTTVALGRSTPVTNNLASQLPNAFVAVPGAALPKLAWAATTAGFAAPSTIAEASVGQNNYVFMTIARVA